MQRLPFVVYVERWEKPKAKGAAIALQDAMTLVVRASNRVRAHQVAERWCADQAGAFGVASTFEISTVEETRAVLHDAEFQTPPELL